MPQSVGKQFTIHVPVEHLQKRLIRASEALLPLPCRTASLGNASPRLKLSDVPIREQRRFKVFSVYYASVKHGGIVCEDRLSLGEALPGIQVGVLAHEFERSHRVLRNERLMIRQQHELFLLLVLIHSATGTGTK